MTDIPTCKHGVRGEWWREVERYNDGGLYMKSLPGRIHWELPECPTPNECMPKLIEAMKKDSSSE